jgi:hypothetical protein
MSYFGSTEWYQRVAQGLVPKYTIVDKWGRNAVVGSVLEPIVSEALAGSFWQPTVGSTIRVAAGGDVADTTDGAGARTIIVEGLNENYALVSETIILAGALASASTSATFCRVHRAFVDTVGTYGGSNADEIMVENTAGTADIITIDAHANGQGQSLHAQYSAPANTLIWLLNMFYSVDSTKTNDVHIKVLDDISQVVAPFGARRTLIEFEGVKSNINFTPTSPIRINKPGISTPLDIWIEGAVGATTSIVTARMQLLMLDTTP